MPGPASAISGRIDPHGGPDSSVGPRSELSGVKRTAIGVYDFAKHGGAVGDIFFPIDQLPANALIEDTYLDILTVPTSGGAAQLACAVEGAGDLVAAAVISGAPWSTTGRKDALPTYETESTYIKTTVPRVAKLTVSVAALTAGKIMLVIIYSTPGQ